MPETPTNIEEAMEDEQIASSLPVVTGYHILITLPDEQETTEGGVFLPDSVKQQDRDSTVVGFVLALGPDCYTDKRKFPSGPWCKEGDFVTMRAYSGTRMKVFGKELRIINDDTVESVVSDPRGITRA